MTEHYTFNSQDLILYDQQIRLTIENLSRQVSIPRIALAGILQIIANENLAAARQPQSPIGEMS